MPTLTAALMEMTPTLMVVLPPCNTRDSTSRRKSSVPIQCCVLGGVSKSALSVLCSSGS